MRFIACYCFGGLGFGTSLFFICFLISSTYTERDKPVKLKLIMSLPLPILALLLLCIFLQNNPSSAFQPPHDAAYSILTRRDAAKTEVVVSSLLMSKIHVPKEDNTEEFPRNESSRRDILQRSFCGIGVAFTASLHGVEPVNAIQNFLLSADDNRGVKGMPVPSKKLGGLSNKIRGVSKIMVCRHCVLRIFVFDCIFSTT